MRNFADPADAARAYDAMSRDFHGEFARPNFPQDYDAALNALPAVTQNVKRKRRQA